MFRAFLFLSTLFWVQGSFASSYSECRILGVVEDVYFNKIHLGVLKYEDIVENNYDSNYENCQSLEGKVVALYDDWKDAADEQCRLEVSVPFKNDKYRNKMKDNFQKGDMLKLDYSFYQSMGPNGSVCMKKWVLLEHVPLKPHSR